MFPQLCQQQIVYPDDGLYGPVAPGICDIEDKQNIGKYDIKIYT
jgi:hypothetical protein